MVRLSGNAGINRTMKVVETLRLSTSGSPGTIKNRKKACAYTLNSIICPHDALLLTVPVHCQSLMMVKVALTLEPPRPNCTATDLLVSVYFDGTIHEILPAIWKVRSTKGSWPEGDVMLTNTCGGRAMMNSCIAAAGARR